MTNDKTTKVGNIVLYTAVGGLVLILISAIILGIILMYSLRNIPTETEKINNIDLQKNVSINNVTCLYDSKNYYDITCNVSAYKQVDEFIYAIIKHDSVNVRLATYTKNNLYIIQINNGSMYSSYEYMSKDETPEKIEVPLSNVIFKKRDNSNEYIKSYELKIGESKTIEYGDINDMPAYLKINSVKRDIFWFKNLNEMSEIDKKIFKDLENK